MKKEKNGRRICVWFALSDAMLVNRDFCEWRDRVTTACVNRLHVALSRKENKNGNRDTVKVAPLHEAHLRFVFSRSRALLLLLSFRLGGFVVRRLFRSSPLSVFVLLFLRLCFVYFFHSPSRMKQQVLSASYMLLCFVRKVVLAACGLQEWGSAAAFSCLRGRRIHPRRFVVSGTVCG